MVRQAEVSRCDECAEIRRLGDDGWMQRRGSGSSNGVRTLAQADRASALVEMLRPLDLDDVARICEQILARTLPGITVRPARETEAAA